MRLSEAVLLGRHLKKAEAGHTGLHSDSGCAIGMGLAAVGAIDDWDVFLFWPWTKVENFRLPCDCDDKVGFADGANGTIAHIFDKHVMRDKSWTLEQLVDWIRSVEPEEAEAVRVESPRNEDEVSGQATPVTELASANLKQK